MRSIVFLIIIKLLVTLPVFAQDDHLPFGVTQKVVLNEILPNVSVSAGYVPDSEKNAIRTTLGFGNIIFERVGVYAAFETGMHRDYASSTLGITATIHRYFYFWGGFDLLSEKGLVKGYSMGEVHKEVGLAITPFSWLVLSTGFSSGGSYSFEIGFRYPLYY